MRIVFLGINNIGQKIYDWLLKQGEDVVSLLTKKEDLVYVSDLKPDLIISGGFRHIISEDILNIPPLGCINLHKAYLPYNRGANPNVWTIIESNPAGVTIHFMDKGIDTGKILAQRKVETNFDDTGKTLYEKLERAQFDLFTEFWPDFKIGNFHPCPQPHRGTFHKISDFKQLRRINLNQTYRAIDLLNMLRAMTYPPFNNCYVDLDGETYFLRLEITKADFNPETKDEHNMLCQYVK